jgi:hypothetical protein
MNFPMTEFCLLILSKLKTFLIKDVHSDKTLLCVTTITYSSENGHQCAKWVSEYVAVA